MAMRLFDQGVLRDSLVYAAKINSVDERGHYIVTTGMVASMFYLYNDGIIRSGVNSGDGATSFWPTQEEAFDYYEKWKAETAD